MTTTKAAHMTLLDATAPVVPDTRQRSVGERRYWTPPRLDRGASSAASSLDDSPGSEREGEHHDAQHFAIVRHCPARAALAGHRHRRTGRPRARRTPGQIP